MKPTSRATWEEFRRAYSYFDSINALDYHTDLYWPQVALETAEQLVRELDQGGQFPPGLRAPSHFAYGKL